jgi:transcriptional regulator with XRE-family HTH domain
VNDVLGIDRNGAEEQIGQRLRDARETLGITQEDAAAALSIPRTSVTAIEKGARNVTATELRKFSALYRRSVEWILGTEAESVQTASALYRATEALSSEDQEQVLRFAQFLASAGRPPQATTRNGGE